METSEPVGQVLVIGADAHFCYLMRRYAEKAALAAIFAYLGEDPLTIAKREHPRVIILEVDAPDTGGWQVLRSLKGSPATAKIPVVLCTWHDEDNAGQKEGAAACLRKPILYDAFLRALVQVGACP